MKVECGAFPIGLTIGLMAGAVVLMLSTDLPSWFYIIINFMCILTWALIAIFGVKVEIRKEQ